MLKFNSNSDKYRDHHLILSQPVNNEEECSTDAEKCE